MSINKPSSMLDPEPVVSANGSSAQDSTATSSAANDESVAESPALLESADIKRSDEINKISAEDSDEQILDEETSSYAPKIKREQENEIPKRHPTNTTTTSSTNANSNTSSANVIKSLNLPTPEIKVIRRKLNGYVGFANLPKQWHRRSFKQGFNLNLLVVGESGLGKSTLINTLFNKELYKPKEAKAAAEEKTESVTIKTTEADIEENGVKLHLTIVDTPGFADQVNNENAWKPIVEEVNSRFDQYLEFENRINRTDYQDGKLHACLYFIEPTGHSLKPLDIEFFLQVHKKVNIIPVIAKSDTLTESEILEFKQRILADLKLNNIEIFQPTVYDNDDEETVNNTKDLINTFPFAIVGSTKEIQTKDGRLVRGRQYPWGVIEVDNAEHNDFVKLRDLLIRNFLEELREKTSKKLYEEYRTGKLDKLGIQQDDTVFREFDPTLKQQEEKALHEAKLSKLEADMKQIFQQKVAEKEKKLQKSEAELFSRHKEVKEKLLKQVRQLEDKKRQLENQRLNAQAVDSTPQPTQKTRKGFLR
ncbi:hypothetical protein WICPIJ_007612 [Wickerhamomyces pijperi]|uniref:Septin-type G domain-containing protein n=1 Tax=Wickerhamomyces pijperi TaxID=599730 RepID=A0A9P8TJY7_WICPI|nr:hypothetical protein WICPIJ_007612 [Wickerhamomyces pijperi]